MKAKKVLKKILTKSHLFRQKNQFISELNSAVLVFNFPRFCFFRLISFWSELSKTPTSLLEKLIFLQTDLHYEMFWSFIAGIACLEKYKLFANRFALWKLKITQSLIASIACLEKLKLLHETLAGDFSRKQLDIIKNSITWRASLEKCWNFSNYFIDRIVLRKA